MQKPKLTLEALGKELKSSSPGTKKKYAETVPDELFMGSPLTNFYLLTRFYYRS